MTKTGVLFNWLKSGDTKNKTLGEWEKTDEKNCCIFNDATLKYFF